MQITKTGLIYDAQMMKHKSRKSHPQKPQRIKAIMKLLEERYFLSHPKVDYVSTIDRFATDDEIRSVHPTKYINYVENLWPKTSHRTDLTILDTYFNEQSNRIARMAVGGLLEGIDKIMKKEWKNGFAVIRPPGHHSGARHTINGFCIFNNVAIGVKYLNQKYKIKRIAIVDWDVHHGDGTQHVFNQDQNLLFFSIHRYDRGSFYPAGDEGNYSNNGIGKGKGSKINIPLSFIDEKHRTYNFQSPGDNQYVYIYHRLIEPVLKEFNPQFILISSGFDAARYDPLGGFSVTPNAYFYLTKKLVQFGKPTLVALQGGYNLTSISQSACGVMKGLLGEDTFPQPIENVTLLNFAKLCSIKEEYHKQLDEIVGYHSKFWKVLEAESLKQYESLIKSNKKKIIGIVEDESSSSSSENQDQKQQKENQEDTQEHKDQAKQTKIEKQQTQEEYFTTQFYFAAGHLQRFKNFSIKNEKIQKYAYQSQFQFYESSFPQKEFAPQFYGKDGSYVIIQNLLYNQKNPIIMDIKLSRQSKNPNLTEQKSLKENKKEQASTSGKYAFRISGYTTPNFKQGGILIKDQNLLKKLLRLVICQSNRQYFCDFLARMSSALKQVKRKYYGTSIMLIKGDEKSIIKWVDFHYWFDNCETHDQDLVEGVSNLRKFISELQLQQDSN